jgi:hypothetical protein
LQPIEDQEVLVAQCHSTYQAIADMQGLQCHQDELLPNDNRQCEIGSNTYLAFFNAPLKETTAGEGGTLFGQGINPNLAASQNITSKPIRMQSL